MAENRKREVALQWFFCLEIVSSIKTTLKIASSLIAIKSLVATFRPPTKTLGSLYLSLALEWEVVAGVCEETSGQISFLKGTDRAEQMCLTVTRAGEAFGIVNVSRECETRLALPS